MKTARFWSGLFIASVACGNPASASDETTLLFPERKIGLPALSLAEVGKENRPPIFKSEISVLIGHRQEISPSFIRSEDKFVIQPDKNVDYKLLIKQPDPSVDYRLIVKNPDAGGKK